MFFSAKFFLKKFFGLGEKRLIVLLKQHLKVNVRDKFIRSPCHIAKLLAPVLFRPVVQQNVLKFG